MPTRTTQIHSEQHWNRPEVAELRGKEKANPKTTQKNHNSTGGQTASIRQECSVFPQRDSDVDLRRRHRADHADRLVRLAAYLPPADRALVEAVYLHGRSAVDIALLSSTSVRRVRCRIRRLVKHVTSPRYLFVLRQRDSWMKTRRQVATAVFIEGFSMRRAAPHLELSYHTVRHHAAAVQTMFEADQGGKR